MPCTEEFPSVGRTFGRQSHRAISAQFEKWTVSSRLEDINFGL
jgi:hypothetical protein